MRLITPEVVFDEDVLIATARAAYVHAPFTQHISTQPVHSLAVRTSDNVGMSLLLHCIHKSQVWRKHCTCILISHLISGQDIDDAHMWFDISNQGPLMFIRHSPSTYLHNAVHSHLGLYPVHQLPKKQWLGTSYRKFHLFFSCR